MRSRALALMIWCCAVPFPVASPATQETLRVEVALVTVGARVTDRQGRDLMGLAREDFILYENGRPRPIAFFSNEEVPISLVILLDRSDSMAASGKLDRAKDAALFLVRSSHPGTEFLYIAFDYLIPRTARFTEERNVIAVEVSQTRPGGGTRLYDAIIEGLKRCVHAHQRRKALVVITDGADQHSTQTLNRVIEQLRESQAQVYLIGYFGPGEDLAFKSWGETIPSSGGREIDNPWIVFERLARESGAEAFFPKSDDEMRQAAENIASDVQRQYTLCFYPPAEASPGTYRRISIKVKRPGAKVRARPGYILGGKPAQ